MQQTYNAAQNEYSSTELFIKRLDEIKSTERQMLAINTYYDCGSVLVCHAGEFRFTFLGVSSPLYLKVGQTLIIYPSNTVTIEATQGDSQLKYAAFGGTKVPDFFDSFGFYDRLVFSGETQERSYDLAVRESTENISRTLAYLQDALATFGQQVRTGPNKRMHIALRAIDRAIRSGRANVKTICAELDISRATLNRTFAEADLGSPRDYIQERIAERATRLLVSTDTPVAEVARMVGIDSPAYFTEFMRRQTGRSPSELRKFGMS